MKIKKMFVLGLIIAVVMMFSAGILAYGPAETGDDPLGDEGTGWILDVGSFENASDAQFSQVSETDKGISTTVGQGVTVDGAKVTAGWDELPPYNIEDYDQDIDYTVKSVALIPCYLEMNIFGNAGYGNAVSVGEGANASIDRTGDNHWMLFNTDFGGVMDADWNFLSSNDVSSDSDVYITACDMWTANLYANVDYGFGVNATELENANEDTIEMEMRHIVQDGDVIDIGGLGLGVFSNGEILLHNTDFEIGSFNALSDAQINMQFRVPFTDVAAGEYNGTVTFKMYSL